MQLSQSQNALNNQGSNISQFDISLALIDINQNIGQHSEQQSRLYHKLITDLNLNPRQKLKHYKKVLQTPQAKLNEQTVKQKNFINKYIKNVILQQYLVGNTQSKPTLMNLLKKLELITFKDIIQSTKSLSIKQFEQIKLWSEVIDLSSRVYHQKAIKQEFQSVENILSHLIKQILTGKEMICNNQFKSKWLITFTEMLRTENLLIRVFYSFYTQRQEKQNTLKCLKQACKQILSRASYLSKQVITQLYLLLVFLNLQQSQPQQNPLCLIHYYHAQSVVHHKVTLKNMVLLIPKLKQTQHKCQLLPLLQQSFIEHYHKFNSPEDKQFRANVFDNVINLFDVGRSIYAYLQTIVKIIIEQGDDWNMEGNPVRRFFIATIVMKILPTKDIFARWPTIVEDIIVQCGNISVPYAQDCAKGLFLKLYEQNNKDYNKWSSLWIQSYKKKLFKSSQKNSIRGVIEFINPILLKICPKPFLLKQLLSQSQKQSSKHNQNLELGIISLIKCYKQIGQIQVNQNQKSFQHVEDKDIKFTFEKIRNFLLSNDEMIAIQALELVSLSLKPSQPIKPMELKLCLEFYRNSLKTSMPEYRKNYLGATKKLFQRLRNIYDSHLIIITNSQNPITADKKSPKKLYFAQFLNFLKQLVDISFRNVFADAIFQLVNPGLQILQLLHNYFGCLRIQIKKGIFLQSTYVLQKHTSFYDFNNFENLLSCLQSSYESVRKLAHNLLNYFTELDKDQFSKALLLDLWKKSLQNTNKLPIRSYEYSCRVLTYISQIYPHLLFQSSQIQKKYEVKQLNILNFFLNLTKQRYIIFKDQFIKQGSNYYNNLVHGLLTIFAYQIEKLSQEMDVEQKYAKKYHSVQQELKQFLAKFFDEIINMLNFAVQISSSNISTVVLDTITQGSQTDKKLKVDCRGHFLLENNKQCANNNDKTNIGTFLESTALISSMEDDQEGIQNTLVVSFYLLTRQAGLVFQSIGGLLSNKHCNNFMPSQHLIKLINTYFYALVNLKHMGSIDRIAKGLSKMSRIIFDHQSKQLSELPQNLLNKLFKHLKDGNFTTILRRSAGIPFAFCCLLKSQSTKRNKLIQKAVTQLLELSRQNKQTSVQLKVHSLNILKRLFQDSDLKGDLDPYVSDAFILSIKGFTCQEWGVRNSSLMLFSTLANRTVGIKPTYNLLEFFIKCPGLFEFIKQQLESFTEQSLNTMYPPLYPIVLLFSRLLPFDLKQKSRVIAQGSMKHIRKEQLLGLLPIFDKSGLNNNYMGRVMTAKAILPFMQIDQIVQYCVNGLCQLPKNFNIDNNMLHYQLAKYYHLLVSFRQICKNSVKSLEVSEQILIKLYKFIMDHAKQIQNLNCGVVMEYIIKIIHFFFQTFVAQMKILFVKGGELCYDKLIQEIYLVLNVITQKYVFQTQRLVIFNDLGYSMMRKEAVSFEFDLLIKYGNKFDEFKKIAIKFTEFLTKKLEANEIFFQTSDNEICQLYLVKILQNIAILKQEEKQQLFQSFHNMLQRLELEKIRSDIILSKVLELRIAINFVSKRDQSEILFLLQLEEKSNNHFLKIAIYKYLTFGQKISQSQLIKLLLQFSNPQSLQQLRQCVVQYLQQKTYQNVPFNKNIQLVHIRLLQDQQYEIRKETAKTLSQQLKVYQYNQNYLKNVILKQISVTDLRQILKQNSDFNIKRKNHEQQRIFAYDKPNKFRSDISTLVDMLSSNQNILVSKQVSSIEQLFKDSLNQKQSQLSVIEIYKNNVLQRNQYQLQLIVRQMLSKLSMIVKKEQNTCKQLQKIIKSHSYISSVYNRILSIQ